MKIVIVMVVLLPVAMVDLSVSEDYWISRRDCMHMLTTACEPGRHELQTRCVNVSCNIASCQPTLPLQLFYDYHCCNCYNYVLFDIIQIFSKIHFVMNYKYSAIARPSQRDLENMPPLQGIRGAWTLYYSGHPIECRLMYADVALCPPEPED